MILTNRPFNNTQFYIFRYFLSFQGTASYEVPPSGILFHIRSVTQTVAKNVSYRWSIQYLFVMRRRKIKNPCLFFPVLVLLLASVERFGVSRMPDFFKSIVSQKISVMECCYSLILKIG